MRFLRSRVVIILFEITSLDLDIEFVLYSLDGQFVHGNLVNLKLFYSVYVRATFLPFYERASF